MISRVPVHLQVSCFLVPWIPPLLSNYLIDWDLNIYGPSKYAHVCTKLLTLYYLPYHLCRFRIYILSWQSRVYECAVGSHTEENTNKQVPECVTEHKHKRVYAIRWIRGIGGDSLLTVECSAQLSLMKISLVKSI